MSSAAPRLTTEEEFLSLPESTDKLELLDGEPILAPRFEEAWSSRIDATLGGLLLPFLGREALIKNKLAAGRDKDLVDANALSRLKG